MITQEIEREEYEMYTVGFIAEQLGGRIIGNNKRVIKSISTLEDIRENSIVFIKNKRNFRSLVKNKQSICVVVDFDPAEKTGFDFIVISREEKNRAFIKLLSLFEENWKHAINVFGENQVSSYVLTGFGEEKADFLKDVEKLISIGVIPYITSVRSIPGKRNLPLTDYNELLEIYIRSGEIMREYSVNPLKNKAGCVRCGGCSAIKEAYKAC